MGLVQSADGSVRMGHGEGAPGVGPLRDGAVGIRRSRLVCPGDRRTTGAARRRAAPAVWARQLPRQGVVERRAAGGKHQRLASFRLRCERQTDLGSRQSSGAPRVDDRPRPAWLPGTQVIEWVRYGGIGEPVQLITTGNAYLSDLFLIATSPRVRCRVEVRSQEDQSLTVRLRSGSVTVSSNFHARRARAETIELAIDVPRARFWSPESPTLYKVSAVLQRDNQVLDRVGEKFGIR